MTRKAKPTELAKVAPAKGDENADVDEKQAFDIDWYEEEENADDDDDVIDERADVEETTSIAMTTTTTTTTESVEDVVRGEGKATL